MIPEVMRVGAIRTSVKLEPEFWGYLAEVARARGLRLTVPVSKVVEATPGRASLASALRVFALAHARRAAKSPVYAKAEEGHLPVDTAAP
jgi:predicted DNA-binding ribbon-helix-helix protein